VGRFFSTFDEAWADFLVREEPLESFLAGFPEEEAYLTIWQAPPGEAAAAEVDAVQEALRRVSGLRMTPRHWLHVSLGRGSETELDAARDRLRGFGAFEAEYGPATCFHEALALEVRSHRLRDLARAVAPERDLDFFLPHLSVAYVEGSPAAAAVRDAVVPLHDRPSVRDRVAEVELCVVPVRRSELLTPWRVAGVVPLD
jgi:hypothetical protein